MRIFLISNMYPSKEFPDFGIFVKNFETKLKEKDVKFPYISVIRQRDKVGIQKLTVYIEHYFSIFKNYLKNDYDIIYIHFLSHNAPIFLVLLSFLKKKSPIVINFHGSDVIKYNSGIWKICNKFLLRRTDLIVVPSPYFFEIVVNKFTFLKEENILVSPSGGIDFKVFYPIKLGNPLNEKVLKLGFVSRIEDDKGWDFYLEALSLLKKKNIKFKAIIAGTGNQVAEMQSQIITLNLSEEVEYLGVIEQKSLRKVYSTLDIFIFSSVRQAESLGLVGIEAMACGVPIIASNMAGPKTYVKNNLNGYLISPGDFEEMATVIIKHKDLSPLLKEKMKLEAISTAKRYDSRKIRDSLYNELLKLHQG